MGVTKNSQSSRYLLCDHGECLQDANIRTDMVCFSGLKCIECCGVEALEGWN